MPSSMSLSTSARPERIHTSQMRATTASASSSPRAAFRPLKSASSARARSSLDEPCGTSDDWPQTGSKPPLATANISKANTSQDAAERRPRPGFDMAHLLPRTAIMGLSPETLTHADELR